MIASHLEKKDRRDNFVTSQRNTGAGGIFDLPQGANDSRSVTKKHETLLCRTREQFVLTSMC